MSASTELTKPPSPAPFEAFLSSLEVGLAATRAAAAGSSALAAAPAAETPQQSTTDEATSSPSLSSSPPSPPSTSSRPSSPPPSVIPSSSSSASVAPTTVSDQPPSSSEGATTFVSGSITPPAASGVTTSAGAGATSTESESAREVAKSNSEAVGTNPAAADSISANAQPQPSGGSSAAAQLPASVQSTSPALAGFDVANSSVRETLLLRFLQLLPSTLDLQLPLNQPPKAAGNNGSDDGATTTKACQQLMSEVIKALRLWVVQQPLTLGRPLGDDNPSLFSLLRPQLHQLHWWRAQAPPFAPASPTAAGASTLEQHQLEDDLLALAWGNRAWQPPPIKKEPKQQKSGSESNSPTFTPPLDLSPARSLSPSRGTVPVVKVEPASAQSFTSIKLPVPSAASTSPVTMGSCFEFNENDANAPPPATTSTALLNKRRRSMDVSLEAPVTRQHGGQAMRKRRKSVIERSSNIVTAAGSPARAEQPAPAVGRDLRKRRTSIAAAAEASTVDALAAAAVVAAAANDDSLASSKKPKFDDEDYVDNREGHHDVAADCATPVRGARGGGRGRGARGGRSRSGSVARGHAQGAQASAAEKDLEGVPKTKARKPESCHRCKNKKEFWVGCPLVASHKYCRGCVVRHFAIDYDDFRANPERYWTTGCPICHLTCPCIGCVRKKKNSHANGGAGHASGSGHDDEDEVGDPDEDDNGDEDEDDDGAENGFGDEDEGYGAYDEDDEAHDQEQEEDVDVDGGVGPNKNGGGGEDDEASSAERLVEVKWTALKRRLQLDDGGAAAAQGGDEGSQHLPVKKRMSRLRSTSFSSGTAPPTSSSSSTSTATSSSLSFFEETQRTHHQQAATRASTRRLRSYSTSHAEPPRPSSMNPEDYLGRTGAGSVLAARYSSPMRGRRGSRGYNGQRG